MAQKTPIPDEKAEEAVRTLIEWIGDDPTREGLQGTPARLLRAWKQDWGTGYNKPDLKHIVRMFSAEGDISSQPMVIVDGIRFASTCEHHMAPFFGLVTIGYIPWQRAHLGLSKFARIVDHCARRLTTQETLTASILTALTFHISPDAAVFMRATHTCMVTRGVRQADALTTTSALAGRFMTEDALRGEFYAAARK